MGKGVSFLDGSACVVWQQRAFFSRLTGCAADCVAMGGLPLGGIDLWVAVFGDGLRYHFIGLEQSSGVVSKFFGFKI